MAFGTPNLEALREMFLGATLTQPFGPSTLSMEPAYAGYPHFHKGVDLVFPGGTNAAIRAPASGVIRRAGNANDGFGNSVIIDSPNGYSYLLGHMSGLWSATTRNGGPEYSSPWTAAGQQVQAGQIIGFQGSTGASTGNHLHLQVMQTSTGTPVNLGTNVKGVFGSLYHTLGFGGGYNPGQYDYAPSATTRAFQPVPNPFPLFSGDPGDPSGTPPAPGGSGAGLPPATQPVDFQVPGIGGVGLPNFSDPTAFFAPFVPLFRNVGGTIVILFIGGMLLIIGLGKLGKEAPVQVVVQPIRQAAKDVGKVAAVAE